MEELLRRAADFFAAHFRREFVIFGLVEGPHLVLKTWVVPPGIRLRPETVRLELDGPGITARVARSGRVVRVDDVTRDPDYVPLYAGSPVRSEIAVPLRMAGRVLGVVNLESRAPAAFTGADEQLLEVLGAHLGFCLEHVRVVERLQRTILQTVTALSALVESKDDYTEGHCQRIAELSLALGLRLGLPPERLEVLTYAAILHDIGKVAVPDAILLKPGPLTPEEFAVMKEHATVGRRVLESIDLFAEVAQVVEQHHERYDGTGYPRGLRGEEILLEARILAVADAFDAMTSTRPYRRALPRDQAVAELRRGAGAQFDPRVVEAFVADIGGEPGLSAVRRRV